MDLFKFMQFIYIAYTNYSLNECKHLLIMVSIGVKLKYT